MPPLLRRFVLYLVVALCFILFLCRIQRDRHIVNLHLPIGDGSRRQKWARLKQQHPLHELTPLPTAKPLRLPKIQYSAAPESREERSVREARKDEIENAFMHSWRGYCRRAWKKDGLRPVTESARDVTSGGWYETLIESLDTLFIMGLRDEFEQAVNAVAGIDFSIAAVEEVDILLVSIRHLGGLLSAYDLSNTAVLLDKAVEVGDLIYAAFDTANRMPVTHWNWHTAEEGVTQTPPESTVLAEFGSMTLELTRLSQLTGDPKWYDAAVRAVAIMEQQQNHTNFPGMWPTMVNLRDIDFSDGDQFSLGSMSGATYEYLPKMHALLGGVEPVYQQLYETAIEAAIDNTIFRPMTPDGADILMSGTVVTNGASDIDLDPQSEHLACYTGGMLALSSRLFETEGHMNISAKLVEGCIWAYDAFVWGIMPEVFHVVPCASKEDCRWDELKWRQEVMERIPAEMNGRPIPDEVKQDITQWVEDDLLPKGFTSIEDRRYLLRSEIIESIFYLYRITGKKELQEAAWNLFISVNNFTRTEGGNAALQDVTNKDAVPLHIDEMQSSWMSETLKYFYLMFSEPHLISLDDYVFNTAGHPFRRPS